MRILLVSQYFPPEPGATQNRVGGFAAGLAQRGHDVTVICEQPCHPAGVFEPGYGRRPLVAESWKGADVKRLWVMASPVKTTARRLAFYGSFAAGAGGLAGLLRGVDVVFASSPPLPGVLAVAGAAAARRRPIVVDVRDLWPAAAEALGELSNRRALRAFEHAERWLYRRAAAVTATTRPFCRHIDAVAGRPVSVHVPNGPLDALLSEPVAPAPRDGPFTVGYVGNHGIAQGLATILDAAEQLRDEPVRFVLTGAGPVKAELEDDAGRRGLANVVFRPAVPVERVGDVLRACHALYVPLRDQPMLGDFVPSKVYDAMAVARPAILSTPPGEATEVVEQAACGLVVAPEDANELAAAVRRLAGDPALAERLGAAGRRAASGLGRSTQVARLEEILSAAGRPRS